MTIDNYTHEFKKVSLKTGLSDSVFAHNFQTSTASAPGNFSGYPAIVRQVTHSQWEQQKVTENYPIIVPGTGAEQCADSKNVIGAVKCNDCGTIELKIDHCESWNCPVCGQRKVRRQARNIIQRLNGFKDAVNTSANPRHIVVSTTRWNGLSIEQISKSVNNLFARYLKELSGVYVIHMFRVRGWDNEKAAGGSIRYKSEDNIKRRLREFKEAAKINKEKCPADFWGMIKQDVLQLGSWREYVYVSPHIHIIGWGYLPNSKKLYEETGGYSGGGFIYKTKEKEGRNFDFYQCDSSFEFTSDILRTLNYLGSHAAIKNISEERRSNRIFRAFGFCSVYKLKETRMMDYKEDKETVRVSRKIMFDKLCPTCRSSDCIETKIHDSRNYYRADRLDDEYNPVDSEGEIIKELVSPIHKFEWSWYHYHFAGYDVRERALLFAERLPHKAAGVPAGIVSPELSLTQRVMDRLKLYDMWRADNTGEGVRVEDV